MSDTVKTSPEGRSTGPAVFRVLDDGTVLYRTAQDADTARQQKISGQSEGKVAKQSEAKLGQQYMAKDGTVSPYSIGALIEFQFTGLIVVILVLGGLTIICSAIGRFIRMFERPVMAAAPQAEATETTTIHPGIDDSQLLVLLTAAAGEALEGEVRIEGYRPMTSKDWSWVAQGRSELLQSHRLK